MTRIEQLIDLHNSAPIEIVPPVFIKCNTCGKRIEQPTHGVFVWIKCKTCRQGSVKTKEQIYQAKYYRRNKGRRSK